MIPKTIHYCWFGEKELGELEKKCINSWKKHLPMYEIIRWDETNFDINEYKFALEAYQNKKFAFVADVARLDVLYNYGGIYLDTDVEIIKPLDEFLSSKVFLGFEDNKIISTALIGSEKGSDFIMDFLSYYHNNSFLTGFLKNQLIPNTLIVSKMMKAKGLKMNNTYQKIEGYATFYPSNYFSPKSHETGIIKSDNLTFSIHHFSGSWLNRIQRIKQKIKHILHKIIQIK